MTSQTEPETETETAAGVDATDAADADAEPGAAAAPLSLSDLLVREGDVAGDYLEQLLDIVDFDGDIDMDVEHDRAAVAIVGDNLSALIGPRGSTLDALQELTRLAVLQATGARSRLMLDVGGYRARRRLELVAVAKNAAERVRAHGDPITLDVMNPFERKVVHDAIAEIADVRSESEGEEPERRVVVLPDP
ncbi:MAG: protein jag [Actinomycetota bacterium]|nr:protein jag [Actinomycetota bacterium]